jgi:hypothetical protein
MKVIFRVGIKIIKYLSTTLRSTIDNHGHNSQVQFSTYSVVNKLVVKRVGLLKSWKAERFFQSRVKYCLIYLSL